MTDPTNPKSTNKTLKKKKTWCSSVLLLLKEKINTKHAETEEVQGQEHKVENFRID